MKKGSRIKISAGEGQRKWQALRPGLKAGAKADESAFAPLDANAVIAQAEVHRKEHPEKAGRRLTNGTFKTRRAVDGDLSAILGLYRFLQPDDPVLDSRDECVRKHWEGILRDERLRYFVAEAEGNTGDAKGVAGDAEGGAGDAEGGAGDAEGAVVSCCALAIVPNLTRGMQPYGLIENVVTAPEWRRMGYATAVLRAALEEAWDARCYKVMLLTGRKSEETLRFYEKAGFVRGVKTGFVAYPAYPAAK